MIHVRKLATDEPPVMSMVIEGFRTAAIAVRTMAPADWVRRVILPYKVPRIDVPRWKAIPAVELGVLGGTVKTVESTIGRGKSAFGGKTTCGLGKKPSETDEVPLWITRLQPQSSPPVRI